MSTEYKKILPVVAVLGFLLYFWANGIGGLDRYPKVHEDETWIAAPGYTFWDEGYFGTDVFAGFYGMERHFYGFMPLFSIAVGGALKLFGMGLFQARLVPLALSLLTLALTYRAGAMLFAPRYGALAVAILALLQITTPTIYRVSGVPLADMARMVRYDDAVPVFGLAALVVFLSVIRVRHVAPLHMWVRLFSVGVLCGLAALVHLYGAFWLPALLLAALIVWRRKALAAVLWSCVGFGLTVLPYVLYALANWGDFRGQYRNLSDRFGLLDAEFYLTNLSREVERYQPVLDAFGRQIGASVWLALLIVGAGWLLYGAVRRGDQSAIVLSVTSASLVAMFAALLSPKTTMYLVTLWPLFALVAAAGFWRLWQMRAGRRWTRLSLLLVALLACGEGIVAQSKVQLRAQRTTPYLAFTSQIVSYLPPDSRILAMQHYWFGLAEQTADYRTLLVTINQTNPRYVDEPISFREAVNIAPPDVIIYDQVTLDFLRQITDPSDPYYNLSLQMRAYLGERHARLITTLHDPSYGELQIYQLDAAAGETPASTGSAIGKSAAGHHHSPHDKRLDR